MADTVYSVWKQAVLNGTYPWSSGTLVRAMLIDSSSTYVPNSTHATVQDLFNNGLVELSATGYSRQTLTNLTVERNGTQVSIKCDSPINFGNIESGYTVVAVLFYVQASDPEDDIPILYKDTAVNLPACTGGGSFLVHIDSQGLMTV